MKGPIKVWIVNAPEVIAVCCSQFGWTPDQCLEMKASQFFLMHKQAKRIQAISYSRLADIAAIPMCQPGYYRSLKEDLKNEILGWDDPPEMQTEETQAANVERQWDSSSVDTKNAMTAFFEAAKRVNGV